MIVWCKHHCGLEARPGADTCRPCYKLDNKQAQKGRNWDSYLSLDDEAVDDQAFREWWNRR